MFKLSGSHDQLGVAPRPHPVNLLRTVLMRCFCCGSSMLHVMSICIWSSAVWSVDEQEPIMLPVLFCFVI